VNTGSISYTKSEIEGVRLSFSDDITLQNIPLLEKQIATLSLKGVTKITIILLPLQLDSGGAIFLNGLIEDFKNQNIDVELICNEQNIIDNLAVIHSKTKNINIVQANGKKLSNIYKIGQDTVQRYEAILSFLAFFGEISYALFYLLGHLRRFRYKEVLFEINENAIKAFGIIALTSFLVGVVIAYQSSVQLATYGANIYIVDMLGLSILRELAPLITAIVIAGRSGSAYTAQIGAMKVTQELDAMKTMGFDPLMFLVLPRIIALMLMMPLLIFVADITGLIGGMIIAKYELGISPSFFVQRFLEVISVKHFIVGVIKGPFFAFLIASIAIFRGLNVRNDTQSIGFNTTKSVVESIFAVIMCDALFSIVFTSLGI
jgi:phospholipid/cholesterol/gamma-HCH transport system permease protein